MEWPVSGYRQRPIKGLPVNPFDWDLSPQIPGYEMAKSGLFYVHFMGDILVLATTRWKLRRAVKRVNQHFSEFRLE